MASFRVARWKIAALVICFGLMASVRPQSVASFDNFASVTGYDYPFWTPDGKAIVFHGGPRWEGRLYRVAASGGEPTLIFNELHRGEAAINGAGRMAFMAREADGNWHIWTANLDGSSLTPLTKNLPGSQHSPAWSPDGSQLAFGTQNGMATPIMVIPASGGEPKRVANGYWGIWSKDGKSILSIGFSLLTRSQAITITPLDGQPRRLTSTAVSNEIDVSPTGFDLSPDGRQLVISRIQDGRWRLDVIDVEADKVITQLPLKGSAKKPRWSPDGKKIAYIQEDTGHPAGVHVVAADGSGDVEVTKMPEFVSARFLTYKSADGTEIPAFLYEPTGPTANRPAIVWLHGGLGGSTLDEFDPAIQYFVANGFVVIAPNYRSSGGYHPALQNLKSGDQIVEDVAASVDYLNSLGSVDPAHIFAFGASFGGWSVLRTITTRPGLFAAAAEASGITDFQLLYETNPGFRPLLSAFFGGPPDKATERYRQESPVFAVGRLTTPLLILHGESDKTVSFKNATALEAALKQAGKPYELIRYPGEDHGLQTPAWRDSFQQVMRYFRAHMAEKPSKPEPPRTRTTAYRAAK